MGVGVVVGVVVVVVVVVGIVGYTAPTVLCLHLHNYPGTLLFFVTHEC